MEVTWVFALTLRLLHSEDSNMRTSENYSWFGRSSSRCESNCQHPCNVMFSDNSITGHYGRFPYPRIVTVYDMLPILFDFVSNATAVQNSQSVSHCFKSSRSHNPLKLWRFDVLLTVYLSIFILVFNQLDAQNLFYNKFYFTPLHVSSTCAHHQEVKIALYSPWYHYTFRCNDTRGTKFVLQ